MSAVDKLNAPLKKVPLGPVVKDKVENPCDKCGKALFIKREEKLGHWYTKKLCTFCKTMSVESDRGVTPKPLTPEEILDIMSGGYPIY